MKKLLLLLLIFVLVLPMVGQEDSLNATKPVFKHQIDLDIELLGIELIYNYKISNTFFVGAGAGIGVFGSISKEGMFFEFLRYNLFLGYRYSDRTHCYIGVKYAPGAVSVEQDDNVNMFGIEYGIFYKVSKIELGIKLSFIHAKETDGSTVTNTVTTSLLVMKVPLFRFK
ncbi:MAG: hypothetical protein RQ875_06135 [Vicingaceae bacterium]|nr:hypothetical protein [Vicingaceae bacterium]